MQRTLPLCVQRRVAQLYLEFMHLGPELDGLRSSGGLVDRGKHEKPFLYLRLDCQPSLQGAEEAGPREPPPLTDAAKRVVRAVDGVMLPGTADDASEAHAHQPQRVYGCTYRVRSEDCHRLDPLFPLNWRNNAHAPPTSPSSSASSSLSPSAAVPFSAHYRAEVQKAFYQCAALAVEGGEWKRSLARGRVQLRKLQELVHMKKYRAMRKRYDWAAQLSADDLLAAFEADTLGGDEAAGGRASTGERLRTVQMGLGNRDTYGYKPE